jgi:hypothetical protein
MGLINADKPHLWKQDIAASVDFFNHWFMEFAPTAYRETRVKTTDEVLNALRLTDNLRAISPQILRLHPAILPALRMSTSPPIARDRLVGLAYCNKNLVLCMEEGKLPSRMMQNDLEDQLASICTIIIRLLDHDIFPWLAGPKPPPKTERFRASTIVADRLCGAVADPIIRNAQERRQLQVISRFLEQKGYRHQSLSPSVDFREIPPGTFTFRFNIAAGGKLKIKVPVDVLIQPRKASKKRLPILIEAKSAGDFTNTNKRRKEEATKIHQLRAAYGKDLTLILFLCGYFDCGYLGYEAAEGLDWVWEHRLEDLLQLGI